MSDALQRCRPRSRELTHRRASRAASRACGAHMGDHRRLALLDHRHLHDHRRIAQDRAAHSLSRREQPYNDHHIHGLSVEAMSEDSAVSRRCAEASRREIRRGDPQGEVSRRRRGVSRLLGRRGRQWLHARPYRALIGHPRLPIGVDTRIFGDIHMMSHLCGATHRGEAREIAELRREKAEIARRFVARRRAQRGDRAPARRDRAALPAVRELTPLEEECERLRREREAIRAPSSTRRCARTPFCAKIARGWSSVWSGFRRGARASTTAAGACAAVPAIGDFDRLGARGADGFMRALPALCRGPSAHGRALAADRRAAQRLAHSS